MLNMWCLSSFLFTLLCRYFLFMCLPVFTYDSSLFFCCFVIYFFTLASVPLTPFLPSIKGPTSQLHRFTKVITCFSLHFLIFHLFPLIPSPTHFLPSLQSIHTSSHVKKQECLSKTFWTDSVWGIDHDWSQYLIDKLLITQLVVIVLVKQARFLHLDIHQIGDIDVLVLFCRVSSIHSQIKLADRPSADDVAAFEYPP